MSNSRELTGFFRESLELVSTWLFDEHVVLGAIATGTSDELEGNTLDLFLSEIRARHALACADGLAYAIRNIEQGVSTKPKIKHSVAKDLSRGQLDIGRYVQNRPAYGHQQGKYPILESYYSAQTPENVLVVRVLIQFISQLSASTFVKKTAEGKKATSYYTWAKGKLKRWPWDTIQIYGDIQWLRIQTEQRILRRRTGNEAAYKAFLQWLDEWLLDPTKISGAISEELTKGLLAFPTEDFFWEHILEVWCLKMAAESLSRLGYINNYGPLPLHQRKTKPIYQFIKADEIISIWFQKQEPMGSPRWKYANGSYLRGIPDIVIHSNKRAPFIIDAKHKLINSNTRSEEIYKMLGYLENFRLNYNNHKFHCALLMSSREIRYNRLLSDNNDKLTLIGVTELSADRKQIEIHIDNSINSWLSE